MNRFADTSRADALEEQDERFLAHGTFDRDEDPADDLDSAPIDDNSTWPAHFRADDGRARGARHWNQSRPPVTQISDADKRALFIEEHPDVKKWLDENKASNSFAKSLSQGLDRYCSLTENQVNAVRNAIARDIDRDTKRAASAVSVAGAGFVALIAAFNQAKDSGLKHPALTFENVTFKLAGPNSKSPGHLWVTGGKRFGSAFYGRVSPAGAFSPSQECPDSIREEVKRIGADPLGESVAHGKRTGNCCACNRPLTDPQSVSNGIGPVCRERFFGGA